MKLKVIGMIYRISCKVSQASFYNLSLLGATDYQGLNDFYLINKLFGCGYVLRAYKYVYRKYGNYDYNAEKELL